MGELDDYLAGLDESERAPLEHLRDLVMELVPDAEQGRSYGMAALRYRGKPLISFVAAKAHFGIYPFSPAAIDAVRDRLGGYSLAKGTIRFSPDLPVPDDVIADLVRFRVAQIEGKR